jgi:hypothetical protein
MKTTTKKSNLFAGRKIVIATMHGKERVIAPLLEKNLGLVPLVADSLDTDVFGTFTGEISRRGSQRDAARLKAFEAMRITNTDLAIASEGSFDAHPAIPFLQSNLELILFVDAKNNLEIAGYHRTGETNIDGCYIKNKEEALEFAHKVGFPEHGIILKKSKNSKWRIIKNIESEEELIKSVSKMLAGIFTKKIYIETDMRAHKNPTRMKAIEKATLDLIANILSHCPHCDAPGFIATDREYGLPCSLCKTPTGLPVYEIYTCSLCSRTEKKAINNSQKYADPLYCEKCNP